MRYGFLALLLAGGSVFAQDTRIGFGVSLEKTLIELYPQSNTGSAQLFDILPVGFTTFSIPILIGGKTRIEPEIGYVRFGSSAEGQGLDYENSSTMLQLALGISGGKRVDNLLYSFGVKAGIVRQSSTSKYEDLGQATESETSQLNFHIGPILGAEYFFISGLSLGAQVGFSYVHVGELDVESDDLPEEEPEISRHIIGNNAKITLRWYY
jgi:hypothetical protein